jgi:hypothetical protein
MYNINIRNFGLLSYGPCNLYGQHGRSGLGVLLPSWMPVLDRPRMLLQNIHNHVCTTLYGVLTQPTLQILTTVSPWNPVPKIINNWNVDGNVTSVNWIVAEQYIFHTVFIITYFIHRPWTPLYFTSQKTKETNLFQYKYIFYDQDHIWWISNLYHNFTTRNLNSDCEIKQHIWHWKAKKDSSISAIPCVILIIWMTVSTT